MRLNQMELPLQGGSGAFITAPVPLPLPWHIVRRRTRKALQALAAQAGLSPRQFWTVRGMAEQQAVLDQLRRRVRSAARNTTGRASAKGLTAFVCSPAGRRAARAMQSWSARVAAQEAHLCG